MDDKTLALADSICEDIKRYDRYPLFRADKKPLSYLDGLVNLFHDNMLLYAQSGGYFTADRFYNPQPGMASVDCTTDFLADLAIFKTVIEKFRAAGSSINRDLLVPKKGLLNSPQIQEIAALFSTYVTPAPIADSGAAVSAGAGGITTEDAATASATRPGLRR